VHHVVQLETSADSAAAMHAAVAVEELVADACLLVVLADFVVLLFSVESPEL
jgi:hypothetical protein